MGAFALHFTACCHLLSSAYIDLQRAPPALTNCISPHPNHLLKDSKLKRPSSKVANVAARTATAARLIAYSVFRLGLCHSGFLDRAGPGRSGRVSGTMLTWRRRTLHSIAHHSAPKGRQAAEAPPKPGRTRRPPQKNEPPPRPEPSL